MMRESLFHSDTDSLLHSEFERDTCFDAQHDVKRRREDPPNTALVPEHRQLPATSNHYGNWEEDHALLHSYDGEEEPYTVEDAVEHMGFGKFQLKVFFICGLFSATDALEMLLLSVLSPVLRCEWVLSDHQVAFITAVVFIGMFSGSHSWGGWSDKYGRLPIMMICSVWIGYFGILAAFSPNYPWVLILRGLVGCGFGGAVQSFTLMSEYMPSKYRAKILIISSCMWAAGSIFEVWMAYIIIPWLGWRYLVGISALPMIITTLSIWTLPESARYLVAAGDKHQAERVLSQAARMNGTTLPKGQLVRSQEASRGRFIDLVKGDYLWTSLGLWVLWFGTAFSYYGMVLAQSEILELEKEDESCHCSLHSRHDYLQMIYSTLGEFAAIPLNLLTIDFLGRKKTLAINYLGAGACFLLIQLNVSTSVQTLFIFGVRAFTAGIFNVVYIYTSEVYPTTVRSIGLGSCSAMARVGAMVTPFIAQVLLKFSLRMALGIYGGLAVVCSVIACCLPIETRGREMKQQVK